MDTVPVEVEEKGVSPKRSVSEFVEKGSKACDAFEEDEMVAAAEEEEEESGGALTEEDASLGGVGDDREDGTAEEDGVEKAFSTGRREVAAEAGGRVDVEEKGAEDGKMLEASSKAPGTAGFDSALNESLLPKSSNPETFVEGAGIVGAEIEVGGAGT